MNKATAMASRKESARKSKKRSKNAGKIGKHSRPAAGLLFDKLVALQARLRAPNGCPWDREQTHSTLRTYLIEEAYEVLDALDSGDDAKFAEELGDVLLQIVFHSQIALEEGRFDIADVIGEIHEKMVRRHPHVFGEKRAKNASEVLKNWEEIKAQERHAKDGQEAVDAAEEANPESLMSGVPRSLPATMEALQLTRRAARIGFDWEDTEGIFDKIREEISELRHALKTGNQGQIEDEIGDLLFAAVNLSRFLHIDPEIALKRANAKFKTRFMAMEHLAKKDGRTLGEAPRELMEALWEKAKRNEKAASAAEASEVSQRR